MIRRPPRSTLFPYTSSSDLRRVEGRRSRRLYDGVRGAGDAAVAHPARGRHRPERGRRRERSEEHTSELQSRPHLVCRLLLEKKKIDDYKDMEPSFHRTPTTS